MPPVVIDIRSAEDSRDVVHRAVQALAEGKLVGLPTETVYGLAASALDESAVARLLQTKQRSAGKALTLAVRSADDVLDFVPDMSPLGRRLARRCWPGPVTIVAQDCHPESLLKQLPPSVQQAVSPQGTIGLRVPAHPVVLDILRMLVGPVVLTSANPAGGQDPVTAEGVLEALGDQVQLVLNDGRSRLGQPSTVVKVGPKGGFEILRAGVVSEQTLKRLSSLIILMVCTGNTCRSPMAEAICKKLIADRLGCAIGELGDRGVMVMSAGISAMMGGRAAAEAVTVMSKDGLNLGDHESQPMTAPMARQADVIWTMTRAHRQAITGQWPESAPRTQVLGGEVDVADPIGGPLEYYEKCAEQLKTLLAERVANLDL